MSKSLSELDENDVVCVVALNRYSESIVTCTSCDKKDSQRYAKYYRSVGYKSKVITYEELDSMQEKESRDRMDRMFFINNTLVQ